MLDLNLKTKIKSIPAIYTTNSIIKARFQEYQSAKELKYYRKILSSSDHFYDSQKLPDLFAERLSKRGIYPVPKPKGELHIFLVYSLYNWESVLPKALSIYGKVSEFESSIHGFDVMSNGWIDKRDTMNNEILNTFKKINSDNQVDIVISYLSGYTCDPSLFVEMGKSGAAIFNFCWDDKLGFLGGSVEGRWTGPAAIASAVDLNLTNAPESVIKYIGEGGLAMFWPEAAHPMIHKPYEVPFEFDVSVLGGNYGWRPLFVKKLKRRGINVSCFGNGWPNGPLSDEDSVKLFSRSRINLGFAGVGHSKKLMCLKGRDFEVPMSGGLYLTQDNPELSIVYSVGEEIITYKDIDDCYDKITWLLDNPDIAEKIRRRGRERALRDHTWEKRFDEIFTLFGFLKNS
jgi:spore maturation protein CgeB